MTRVLVVDDHVVIRDSFKDLLARMPGYELVADIANADLAEAVCARLRPDLVLLDVCTEGNASGLVAASRLHQRFPLLKIIVMSGFDEISYNERARAAGASAFVLKSVSMDEFERVICAVMAGDECFSDHPERPLPEILAELTDHELQILRLLCHHRSRREIAAELYISEITVKRHIAQLLAKTGFVDSVELAFHMITNGWIDPRY